MRGGDGGGAGHRRPAAERRQLHGAHAALVPRARRADPPGQGLRRARARALHLGRHLHPLPPPRLRPRAPIRRPRKHGAASISSPLPPYPFYLCACVVFFLGCSDFRRESFFTLDDVTVIVILNGYAVATCHESKRYADKLGCQLLFFFVKQAEYRLTRKMGKGLTNTHHAPR